MKLSNLLVLSTLLFGFSANATTPKNPQSPAPKIDADTNDSGSKANKSSQGGRIANTKERITALGTVSTDVEGDFTIVTARLNQKPSWNEVSLEEHGTFLQIKFPKTQIPASGEFIDGNGPFLKKIATFQLPGDDGALRLFLNLDAAKAKLATTAELLGERIIISIDHRKLEQLIAPQSAKTDTMTAEDVVAKTVVDKSLPAPSDQITNASKDSNAPKDSNSTGAGDSTNNGYLGQDLYGKLARVAAFVAVLLGALLAAQTLRSRRRNNGSPFRKRSEDEPVTMKILSNINLGQKQRLTLVQVGHQQLLLGVGADSINLLTTIEPKSRSRDFAMSLETANPNGTVRLKSPEDIQSPKAQRRTIAPTSTTTRPESPVKGGRINVGVGDDGIAPAVASSSKTDDITKLLRDRLRNIPPR
jgi:flagellar biogenesis protein FliO